MNLIAKTTVKQNKSCRLSGVLCSPSLSATSFAMAAPFVLWANPALASEPVYFAQPWFHRGPDVNLLTTPAGVRLAVDNQGRHFADESITGKNNRFNRLDLDSLQACAGEIELLPALPSAWPAGTVKGLRARGGYEVDIEWKDGKLTRATLHNISSPADECTVRYQGVDTKLTVPPGQLKVFAGNAPAAN